VLFLRPEVEQIECRQVFVRAETRGHARRSAASELLGHNGIRKQVGTGAADLVGILQTEKAEFADARKEIFRKLLGGFPCASLRLQFPFDEGTDFLSELVMLRKKQGVADGGIR
jgi:hypothetical protein